MLKINTINTYPMYRINGTARLLSSPCLNATCATTYGKSRHVAPRTCNDVINSTWCIDWQWFMYRA